MTCSPKLWVALLYALAAPALMLPLRAATPAEQIEFFEKRVRPVLVERCYRCHSAGAEKVKGGLVVDTRAGLLKGGERGPAIEPEHPERSRLLEAVAWSNPDLQMPPKGKLPEQDIAALREWVQMRAPWPDAANPAPMSTKAGFDLETRRQRHWAWQPLRVTTPPPIKNKAWARNPVDQFILARLEERGLSPAPAASNQTLVRRLSFDLLGLPPAPTTDTRESVIPGESYSQQVDELLASPHFGERWARHWLDLVRYAETLGHEFDYSNPNAWRYRDYVIRAFNADVPYKQFVVEHIAGDLLNPPRRHPVEGINESVIGTAFYWLGQRDHSPVDIRQHQAEIIDNQIDVLTKTFLGLTVACARCHDHKFDAISSEDYYALYGILSSSRYTQAALDSPERTAPTLQRLTAIKARLRRVVAETWSNQVNHAAESLQSALAAAANSAPKLKVHEQTGAVLADFADGCVEGWLCEGEAFGDGPAQPGEFVVGSPGQPVARVLGVPALHSGLLSLRLQGVARSSTFTITNRYLHILAAGRDARINVPVENFTMIRDPIYGGLKRVLNNDEFHWVTIDLAMWQGRRAYIELNDTETPDPADDAHPKGYGVEGCGAMAQAVFSEQPAPPALPDGARLPQGSDATVDTLRARISEAVAGWGGGESPSLTSAQAALLDLLVQRGDLDASVSPEAVGLAVEYHKLQRSLPNPIRTPALVEGSGLDEPVFVRGNPRTPGKTAPRRFLQALGGTNQPPIESGSGRRELAERMTCQNNALLARVVVNRVWLHLFGRGLVATPDDFGELGQAPSHPELLDWLAEWFRTEDQWSLKGLIRLLVNSNTYRMSSKPDDPVAEEKDPDNILWHRMPVRRLEGEAIRDAILAVTGELKPDLYGPPVAIHLTQFMDGRGRPALNGPLDGARRRSIYIEVRRNFVSPMMRAFDTPVPFTTVGRRTVSNVPGQSLFLLNDPFVLEQAERWAKRLLALPGASPEARVASMYQSAFHRPPSAGETAQALQFLADQKAAYLSADEKENGDERAWTDLCHVLFNVKEFVFIN